MIRKTRKYIVRDILNRSNLIEPMERDCIYINGKRVGGLDQYKDDVTINLNNEDLARKIDDVLVKNLDFEVTINLI